jgi:erythronate-4-phosphate dehydrogenase
MSRTPLRIVLDRNTPLVASAFKGLGNIVLLDTREMTARAMKDADILVVRSETRVNRELLEGSRVRFVGTVTIGTDHIDIPYLESRGIAFASAPGSNANSVKEYLLGALLELAVRRGFSLKGRTLGIVGVGNIGSRVAVMAAGLGLTVLQNDPPLARQTRHPRFVPLDDLMSADILTLHVPLTRTGEDATFHLFDGRRIAALKPGAILINSSRGPVVQTGALRDALRRGHLSAAVLDVWEGEPAIDAELLELVTLGTPHIAGYSLDGKVNAVAMIREAVCRFLSDGSTWEPDGEMPAPDVGEISLQAGGSPEEQLRRVVRSCYDIAHDDRNLRRMLNVPPPSRANFFAQLRSGYRIRREFHTVRVNVPADLEPLRNVMAAAGFRCQVKSRQSSENDLSTR